MKKDKLTKDIIKTRILKAYSKKFDFEWFLLTLIFAVIPFVIWCITDSLVSLLICIIIILASVAISVYDGISKSNARKAAENGELTITEVWVQSKQAAFIWRDFAIDKPNRVVMSNGYVYRFQPGIYYSDSTFGGIRSIDLFNSTEVGDKFYMVNLGNRKNIFAYSAKYFEPEGLEIEKAYEDDASTAE